MNDFTLVNDLSIAILTPNSEEAREWVAEYLPTDCLTFGGGVVIEPRYLDAILEGIEEYGLSVTWA